MVRINAFMNHDARMASCQPLNGHKGPKVNDLERCTEALHIIAASHCAYARIESRSAPREVCKKDKGKKKDGRAAGPM
jgi:hypothetical protein